MGAKTGDQQIIHMQIERNDDCIATSDYAHRICDAVEFDALVVKYVHRELIGAG